MKKIILALFIILGISIGVFVGLGGLDGIGWVAFIVVFPLIYIFGAILLGKESDDEKKELKNKSKWDKYE